MKIINNVSKFEAYNGLHKILLTEGGNSFFLIVESFIDRAEVDVVTFKANGYAQKPDNHNGDYFIGLPHDIDAKELHGFVQQHIDDCKGDVNELIQALRETSYSDIPTSVCGISDVWEYYDNSDGLLIEKLNLTASTNVSEIVEKAEALQREIFEEQDIVVPNVIDKLISIIDELE